jgi:hypothetical protein
VVKPVEMRSKSQATLLKDWVIQKSDNKKRKVDSNIKTFTAKGREVTELVYDDGSGKRLRENDFVLGNVRSNDCYDGGSRYLSDHSSTD